jgi:hypothetical protein
VFFNPEEIGNDSAIGRRSTTIRLIQELVESAAGPVSQAQIREGLFHGRVNGSTVTWKNTKLATGRARCRFFRSASYSGLELRHCCHGSSSAFEPTAIQIRMQLPGKPVAGRASANLYSEIPIGVVEFLKAYSATTWSFVLQMIRPILG